MSEHDRELAEAIYAEIIAAHSVAEAKLTWAEHKDMRYLLAHIATWAIDAVLARRLREAARTGPWGNYDEGDGYPWVMLPRKRTP